MPRIRSIKPEFWDDEKLSRICLQANLLYIGMWNFSDDEGIVRSGPSWLKSKIFPHRDELRISDVKAWVKDLQDADMLVPFEYNNEGYYWIRKFNVHQKIDKPQKSKIPEDFLSTIKQNYSPNIRRIGAEGSLLEWKGMEEEGNVQDIAREVSENVTAAHTRTAALFKVGEIRNARTWLDIGAALVLIEKEGVMGEYLPQLEAYFSFKKATAQQLCNPETWLWGKDRNIQSGDWRRHDWVAKLAEIKPKEQTAKAPTSW